MLKLLTVVALLGVGCVFTQTPHHCFSPPELSFRAVQFDHEATTFKSFQASYDVRHQRLAFLEEKESMPFPGKQYLWIIMLHEEDVVYEFNMKTRVCNKFKAGHFYPFGTPESSKFYTDYTIGGPGESVESMLWGEGNGTMAWMGVFTRAFCYPVMSFVAETHKNRSQTTQFYDTVDGITDPSIFIPPAECTQAAVLKKEMSQTVSDLMSIYTRKLV